MTVVDNMRVAREGILETLVDRHWRGRGRGKVTTKVLQSNAGRNIFFGFVLVIHVL